MSINQSKLLPFANKLLKVFRNKADVLSSGQEDFTITVPELHSLNTLLNLVCNDEHSDGNYVALPDGCGNSLHDMGTNLHDFVQQFRCLKILSSGVFATSDVETVTISCHFSNLSSVKVYGSVSQQIYFSSFPCSVTSVHFEKFFLVNTQLERLSVLSTRLRALTLTRCDLEKINFPLLQSLSALEFCDLSFNRISSLSSIMGDNVINHSGTSDAETDRCSMTYLNLSHNQLRDVLGLEMMPHLMRLDLSYNCLTVDSAGWPELRQLDQLEQLDLVDNPISMCGNYRIFIISLLPLPQIVLMSSSLRRTASTVKLLLPSMLAMENVTGVRLDDRPASYGEIKLSRQTFKWNFPEKGLVSRKNSCIGLNSSHDNSFITLSRQRQTSLSSSALSVPSIHKNISSSSPISNRASTSLAVGSPEINKSMIISSSVIEQISDVADTPQGSLVNSGEFATAPAQDSTPSSLSTSREAPPPTSIAEPFLVQRIPSDRRPILLSLVYAEETSELNDPSEFLVSGGGGDTKLELIETAVSGTVLRRLAAPLPSAVTCEGVKVQFWTTVLTTSLNVDMSSPEIEGDVSSSVASSSLRAAPGARTFVSLIFDLNSEASRFVELLDRSVIPEPVFSF